MKAASWTIRNGKSPTPKRPRQSRIIVGRSVRYWACAAGVALALVPVAPLIANGTSGATMPL